MRLLSGTETCVVLLPANGPGTLFQGMNWLGLADGAVTAFGVGRWHHRAEITMERGDMMRVHGLTRLGVIGALVFIVIGYCSTVFLTPGGASRAIDAGGWALPGVLMLGAQWVL